MSFREVFIERPLGFLRQQRIFRDRFLRWFLVLAVLSSGLVWVQLLIELRPSDFVVPLEYATGIGLLNLGNWYRIYSYGIFSLFITIVNLLLAVVTLERSRIASFFLILGVMVVNVFTFIVVHTLLTEAV